MLASIWLTVRKKYTGQNLNSYRPCIVGKGKKNPSSPLALTFFMPVFGWLFLRSCSKDSKWRRKFPTCTSPFANTQNCTQREKKTSLNSSATLEPFSDWLNALNSAFRQHPHWMRLKPLPVGGCLLAPCYWNPKCWNHKERGRDGVRMERGRVKCLSLVLRAARVELELHAWPNGWNGCRSKLFDRRTAFSPDNCMCIKWRRGLFRTGEKIYARAAHTHTHTPINTHTYTTHHT